MRYLLTVIQIASLTALLIAAYVILDTWEFIGAVGVSGLIASLYAENQLMRDE
jgi:hypothetical protein